MTEGQLAAEFPRDARWMAAAASRLGVDLATAVVMRRRGGLASADHRASQGWVRLEPSLPGLDGWPGLPGTDHSISLVGFRAWQTSPVGPFYVLPAYARKLVEAAQPGSTARTALVAALWEAQGD